MKIKKQLLPEAVKNEVGKMLRSKKNHKEYSMSDRRGYSYELEKNYNRVTVDIYDDSYQWVNSVTL